MKKRVLSLAEALAKRNSTTVRSSFVAAIAKGSQNSKASVSKLATLLAKGQLNPKNV